MSEPLSFKQEITAVFGQPVAENPTQVMIEAAFADAGLAWRYLTLEVAPSDLAAAVSGAKAMGFRGFNLTIPHKVEVIQHLDRLSEAAEKMGAVNCVIRDGDELIGENTDGKGFVESLREVSDPQGQNVVILGAGGAARAIAIEMALAGAAKFTIVNRSMERGEQLTALIQAKTGAAVEFVHWTDDYDIPAGTHVVINATSIGLFPDVEARIPLNTDSLTADMVVADVIPNPPATRLVREATAAGCTVLDGLGMLVNQGVIGFRLWTGVEPNPAVMRAALEEVFG
ncbi:shikimate dehydrogenase [Symmachiella dynata]|uniref:shikimate dehydrogenase n=1 Tax=Symmachiella dynata TaxID=2527995 RepID=UPI0030EC74CA